MIEKRWFKEESFRERDILVLLWRDTFGEEERGVQAYDIDC